MAAGVRDWTVSGGSAGQTCNDWAPFNTGILGTFGETGTTSTPWTNSGTASCTQSMMTLLCFEE